MNFTNFNAFLLSTLQKREIYQYIIIKHFRQLLLSFLSVNRSNSDRIIALHFKEKMAAKVRTLN